MTRRVIVPQPSHEQNQVIVNIAGEWYIKRADPSKHLIIKVKCPYGQVGDLLYVKETFSTYPLHYKADGYELQDGEGQWNPSLFMPKKYARIWLEITGLRAERLQEITEEDAKAEGVGYGFTMNAGWPDYGHIVDGVCELTQDSAVASYASL